MRIDTAAQTVAIVSRTAVKFLQVVKCDKRGKLTLEDGTEWNSNTGRRWGDSGRFRMFPETLTTKEQGERTRNYREAEAKMKERMWQYQDGVAKINSMLNFKMYELDNAKDRFAAVRAELDKLEAMFDEEVE